MKNYDRVSESIHVKYYYLGNEFDRLDGPAVEYADGVCLWYRNGKLHREDGPAAERADGRKLWFFEGEQYFFKEWLGLVWDGLSEERKRQYIFGGFNEEL